MFKQTVLILFFAGIPLFATANEALKAQLDKYVGKWVGVFTVEAEAIDYLESFPVEQKYWWEGSVLRGVAVMRRENGIVSSTTSNVIDGDKILSSVKKNGGEQVFYGTLVDEGLLWFPANLDRANNYQIKEHFTTMDGERMLVQSGFDTFDNNGEAAVLIYRGEFVLGTDEAGPED